MELQVSVKRSQQVFTRTKSPLLSIILTRVPESVAEHVKRPLYTVTAGDFAGDLASTEKRLSAILNLASHWNAVLLIDEADVFLEQRSFSDIKRNAIVSGKYLNSHWIKIPIKVNPLGIANHCHLQCS